ncbi:MAG: hypothetical protein OSA95_10320 [Opitutales bacterium]|nr:hypothetical protein [Opitutales bacterium]
MKYYISKIAGAATLPENDKLQRMPELDDTLTKAWDMLNDNPGVTVGDLVLHLLAIADMDFDKASMVGAMVDAAIIEHWEQEEAAI